MTEVTMYFVRSTKTTYIYGEGQPDVFAPAGVVYINKEKLPTKPPRIKVTVEELPPS